MMIAGKSGILREPNALICWIYTNFIPIVRYLVAIRRLKDAPRDLLVRDMEETQFEMP
jgi:hypothetical protein